MRLATLAVAVLAAVSGAEGAASDWIVTGQEVVEDRAIVLDGDLIVHGGASLTLRRSTLTFNNESHGEHGIRVETGGGITVEQGSLITAARSEGTFFFIVEDRASLAMEDSELRRCGATTENWREGTGLIVRGSVQIRNCRFAENDHLFLTGPGSGGEISGSTFEATTAYQAHVAIAQRTGVTLSGNTFGSCPTFSITMGFGHSTRIAGNTFVDNGEGAAHFWYSWDGEFSGNTVLAGGGPWATSQSGNILIADNRFVPGVGINPGGAGVAAMFARNVSVLRNTFGHNMWNVLVAYSSDCTVADNVIEAFGEPDLWQHAHIELHHASRNVVANNTIRSRRDVIPMWQRTGILVWGRSSDNVIQGNEIDVGKRGIVVLWGSDRNLVTDNTVEPTDEQPVIVEQSSDNVIHHNNFFGGGRPAFDDTGTNRWDDGSAGNYWGAESVGGSAPYPVLPAGQDDNPLQVPVAIRRAEIASKPALPIVIEDYDGLVVSDEREIAGQTIGPYRWLEVKPGAKLVLRDTTVQMVGDGHGIIVRPGGALEVLGSRLIPLTPELGGWFFQAEAGSSLVIRDSEVRGVGAWPGCGDWVWIGV